MRYDPCTQHSFLVTVISIINDVHTYTRCIRATQYRVTAVTSLLLGFYIAMGSMIECGDMDSKGFISYYEV